MLNAALTIKKSIFGYQYTSNKEIGLPQSWEQAIPLMKGRKFLNAWSKFVLNGDMVAAHVTFVHKILDGYYKYASALDIDEILMSMPWMSMHIHDQDIIGNPLLDKLWIPGLGMCHWCKAHGENMSLREFIFLDDFLGHHADEDPLAPYHMLATICRQKNPDKESAIKREDIRIPLVSRDQVKAFAKVMKRYDDAWILRPQIRFATAAALLFTLYMKKFVNERYIARLNQGTDPNDNNNQLDFGWHTIAQQIAESGVFGNIDDVYDYNIHDLCIYLINKKQESDRIKSLNEK